MFYIVIKICCVKYDSVNSLFENPSAFASVFIKLTPVQEDLQTVGSYFHYTHNANRKLRERGNVIFNKLGLSGDKRSLEAHGHK